jgi:hypothetical protein
MLEVMREPIFVGGQECFVTASVGVALYPRDGTTVADLMRNSDVAMYSAKNAGAQRLAVYSPQLAGRGREKLELESALHKAIERNELVLHYQPKIDVRSRAHGRRRGADALAARRRAGAAGRVHPAGRGDRPDRADVRVGAARGGAPGQGLADRASASPTPSRSTCPAGCSSAATWSSTSTRRHGQGVPHRVILLEITETT